MTDSVAASMRWLFRTPLLLTCFERVNFESHIPRGNQSRVYIFWITIDLHAHGDRLPTFCIHRLYCLHLEGKT
jgi:hypothetical protein